jgi:hypothetical protein
MIMQDTVDLSDEARQKRAIEYIKKSGLRAEDEQKAKMERKITFWATAILTVAILTICWIIVRS